MKLPLALILSFVGGYIDTAGFLALQGLFTAHVTGNFVTFGAAILHGTTGAWAKLLVLPVFCLAVISTRLTGTMLEQRGRPALLILLSAQVAILILGAAMAIALGPFPDGDKPAALATGMVLVAAMAVQNAAHRAHLADAPPSTLMTGTTTQVMIDIADLMGNLPDGHPARGRIRRMVPAVVAFALGCGIAALLTGLVGAYAFCLAPLVLVAGLPQAGQSAVIPGKRILP